MRKLGKSFHVLSMDPALRQPRAPVDPEAPTKDEAAALAAYEAQLEAVRAAGDISGLPLAGTRKPAIWRVQGLTMHGEEELSPAGGNRLRMARIAIQHGLAGMDGAVGSDGEKLDYAAEFDGREKVVLYAIPEEIKGAYGRAAIIELGNRILELSEPNPFSGQG